MNFKSLQSTTKFDLLKEFSTMPSLECRTGLTDNEIFKFELILNIRSKTGLMHFCISADVEISFVNNSKDIEMVKKLTGKNSFIISKIETKNAIINLKKIANISNALLIDRGDLSRYIPIEKIPVAQEMVIKNSIKLKIPTYIATNLLETMIKESLPTRAESHDIFSSLNQGCAGLVLAAETAIGSSPIECVKFLKRCIKNFLLIKKTKFSKMSKMKYLLN